MSEFKFAEGEIVQAIVGDGSQPVTIIRTGTALTKPIYEVEFSSGKRLNRFETGLFDKVRWLAKSTTE